MPRSKPVLVVLATFAGLDILLGGAVLGDFIDPEIVGLVALLSAAVQGGFAVYLSGSNTPTAQVVATQQNFGAPLIAGPASSITTGDAISTDLPVGEITTALEPQT